MAQQKAATPTKTRFLCFFEKLRNQGPKRFPTSLGNLTPKLKHNISHVSLAMGQSKKQMLDRLRHTTEATLSTPLPLPFHQIIFG
jgi:hypothetical protein